MGARVQVTGIGGVFFKARDPVALAAWYREHLGVPVAPDGTHAMFAAGSDAGAGDSAVTVWSTFPADTKYFGPGAAGWMINYRVEDLDGMVAQLREAGVTIDDVQDGDYGRFAWATDPEGNRFELWQPPAGAPPDGSDAAEA